jgi:hypothetical protein
MVSVALFDGHELDFPVWVIVDTADFDEFGLAAAYRGFVEPGIGPVFSFFTDEDLAKQFMEDKSWANLRPYPIEDLISFRELVESANENGASWVALDPSGHGNIKSKLYSLDEFLKSLGKAEEAEN